ncbi:unnamed protein product [Heligmosomoides polygyrus]|uniref:Small VCP/p97-interacting protein n=1 Tax=Heligmosomoides polygyrus TaxID=6339 RepID=A0A183G288_HELPZ|nr:unnamed protein product [Heligmosomoides polygyrus]
MTDAASKAARLNSLLNRKRKVDIGGTQPAAEPSPGPSEATVTTEEEPIEKKLSPEEERKRKATEAIIREAKRARQRAEMVGPQGWIRPKSLNTNKEFLHRTLAATLPGRKPKRQKSPEDVRR